MDMTKIRVGDIVTCAGQQWRVIRWTHDRPGIYSCDLEPIETAPDPDPDPADWVAVEREWF